MLKPEGILLLTVPNPFNFVRKLEGWLQSMLSNHRLPSLLQRVRRVDTYTTYLRLSRNRFRGDRWESVLNGAGFVALHERFLKSCLVGAGQEPVGPLGGEEGGKQQMPNDLTRVFPWNNDIVHIWTRNHQRG